MLGALFCYVFRTCSIIYWTAAPCELKKSMKCEPNLDCGMIGNADNCFRHLCPHNRHTGCLAPAQFILLTPLTTKVRPESAGETTLLHGHLSRPRIDISCRVHVVESSAASVGGAHVEGALFSESRKGKGKLGWAWKLNRPTTSSRTFSGCIYTEAVFSCNRKFIQYR